MVKGLHSSETPPLSLPLGKYAFFLDFDGTLVGIVPQPDQVQVTPRLIKALQDLQAATGGALAVVSGRAIETLDHFLQPLKFPAAGIHGAEFRLGNGEIETSPVAEAALTRAKEEAKAFAEQHAGLLYEEKSASFALHYRQAEHLADEVNARMERLVAAHQSAFELQRGKMVIELKPRGCHKGAAIERLMSSAPFQGKTPVYMGDDVTDEDAFRTVNEHHGLSIKVGTGDTCAKLRLDSQEEVLTWLEKAAASEPGVDLAKLGKAAVG